MSDEELIERGLSDRSIADLRELADANDTRDATYPAVIPPCPSWCGWPVGHAYHGVLSTDFETHVRFHNSGGDRDAIRVTQEERYRAGVVSLGVPYLEAWLGEPSEFSASDARRTAAVLVEVAAALEHIEAADALTRAQAAR